MADEQKTNLGNILLDADPAPVVKIEEPVGLNFGAEAIVLDNELEQERNRPPSGEIWAAAIRSENVIGNLVYGPGAYGFNIKPYMPAVEDYDPFDEVDGVYLDYLSSFETSDSPQETAWIKAKIDMELKDRETLRQAGGKGMLASIGAGVADPINFVPIAGWGAKGAQVTRTGGRLARGFQAITDPTSRRAALMRGAQVGTVAGLLTEAPLQYMQETRTWQESTANVVGAATIGGLLTVGGAQVRRWMTPEDVLEYQKSAANYMNDAVDPEELFDADKMRRAVGADEYVEVDPITGEDLTLGGRVPGRLLIKGQQLLSPAIRVLSARSTKARELLNNLVEHPFIQKMHERGRAMRHSVELYTQRYNGMIANTTNMMNDSWNATKTILKEAGFPAGRRARDEYRRHVMTAARILSRFNNDLVGKEGRNAVEALFGVLPDTRIPSKQYLDEVINTAMKMRDEVLMPIYSRGLEVGRFDAPTSGGQNTSGLTNMWDRQKILDNLTEFNALATELLTKRGMSPDEAAIYAPEVTNRILGIDKTKIADEIIENSDAAALLPGRLVELDLVEEAGFNHFFIDDPDLVVRTLVRQEAGKNEMKAMLQSEYGGQTMEEVKQAINEEYLEMIAKATKDTERNAIKSEQRMVMKDLEYLINDLNGVQPDMKGFTKFMLTMNAARQLGNMTISAFADIGRPIMVHGTSRTSKAALKSLMNAFSKEGKLPVDEMKKFGVAVEMELNTRYQQMFDIHQPGHQWATSNPILKIMRWTSNQIDDKLGKLTGMNLWNDSLKRTGAIITQDRTVADILNFANLDKKGRTRLARLGLSEEDIAGLAVELKKPNVRVKHKSLTMINYDKMGNQELIDKLQLSILRETNEIINTPTLGTLPRWARDNDMGRLFFQYKSFMAASHQQTLIAGLQRSDAQALQGLGVMVGMGMFSRGIKQGVRLGTAEAFWDYYDDNGWDKLAFEAVDQSGVMSIPMAGLHTANAFAHGKLLEGLTEEAYYTRSFAQALGGPTIGTVEDISRTVSAGMLGAMGERDLTRADARRAAKLLPFSNLWAIGWAVNRIDDEYMKRQGQ